MKYARNEVEQAFQKYWALGAVGEDWDAWCDECFTDDVTYIEHILGNRNGREEVRAWIKPTMEEYGEIYTAYEWHMVNDDGRVVVYMQNRRDHPDEKQPPIDFAGITILQYAGDGKFSLEEDFWSLPEGIRTGLIPIEENRAGESLCETGWVRVIPAPPNVPRITAISDGVNLLSGTRIVTGTVKITMANTEHPERFVARVDTHGVTDLEDFCTDPAMLRYEFNLRLPKEVAPGPHNLWITMGRREFPPIGIEVA